MIKRLQQEHLLCLAAFVGPVLSVLASNGLVPFTAMIAVGCLLLAPDRAVPRGWNRLVLVPLVALPAWAAVTALWGIAPTRNFLAALQLAGVTAIGIILVASACQMAEPHRRRLMICLVAGASVAQALLLGIGVGIDAVAPIQRLFVASTAAKGVVGFGRGFVVMMVLAPLVIYAGWRLAGWRLALPLLAAALASAVVTHSIAVKGGVLMAAAVALLSWRWGGATARTLRVVLVALIMVAPVVPRFFPPPVVSWETMRWIPTSTHHRMTIWQFTAARIAEAPLFGWGMDAARDIPGGEDSVVMVRDGDEIPEQFMPLHPHNAWLQVWLELGLIGAVIVALLAFGLAAVPLRAPHPVVRAAMTASVVAVVVAASVSFGTWQSWWLCALGLTAALWAPLATRA